MASQISSGQRYCARKRGPVLSTARNWRMSISARDEKLNRASLADKVALPISLNPIRNESIAAIQASVALLI